MRISFNKEDAGHIYELLLFYWVEHKIRFSEMELNKFGNCPLCMSIGKRLEKFIGEDEIKFVEKLAKNIKKKYEK